MLTQVGYGIGMLVFVPLDDVVKRRRLMLALASFGLFAIGGRTLAVLVLGVLLMDVGVQANHVSNLTRVHALRPEARSRMNTVYMVTYFAGGALGTALGTWAWSGWGWQGV